MIGSERTDTWLANTLAPCQNMDEAVIRIGEAAARHFAQFNPAPHHAFVAVGWVRARDLPLTPVYLTISNALNAEGRWVLQPRSVFELRKRLLPASMAAVL